MQFKHRYTLLILLNLLIISSLSAEETDEKTLKGFQVLHQSRLNIFKSAPGYDNQQYTNNKKLSEKTITYDTAAYEALMDEYTPIICEPGFAGESEFCTIEGANISRSSRLSTCNSRGTRFNFETCEVVDCNEGFSGPRCEISNS